jgi:hypothetical protein
VLKKKSKGTFLAAGRIGTVLLGFVGLNALYWFNGDGLYIIFAILSLASGILIYRLPLVGA